MTFTADEKALFLARVNAMLDDPTLEVEHAIGINRSDDGSGYWHFEPARERATLTLKIGGGASEEIVSTLPSWMSRWMAL